MMKKYVLAIIAFSMLAACGGKQARQEQAPVVDIIEDEVVVSAPQINIRDSLRIQQGLGDVVEHQYAGELPAADGPGIQYDLSLFYQEQSKEGVFDLNMTYLEANNGKDESFREVGKFNITNQKIGKGNETIYELHTIDGSDKMFFILDGENLTLLNNHKKKINSGLNYTLIKKK